MISRPFKIGLVLFLAVACGAVFVFARLENAKLRRRIAGARTQKEQTEKLKKQNDRTRELVQRLDGDREESAREIDKEVAHMRQEIADLEQRAEQMRAALLAQNAHDAQSLANNRNPELGLVRLENFEKVGQSTPAAAFETFVWAAMKGDDPTMESMISIGGAAREKVQEIIATLPEPDRKSHGTPEKLVGLFMANAFTSMPSAQIVGVALSDAQRAVVTVRGLTSREQKVPMQLGAQGWQMVIPEQMVEGIGKWAQSRPPQNK